jgi:hypothetical protein
MDSQVSDSCAEMSSCRNYHHVTRDVEHANKASAQECTAPMQPPELDGVLHGKGSKQFPAQTLGAGARHLQGCACTYPWGSAGLREAAPEKYTIGRRRNVTIVTGTRNSLVFVAMTPRYRCGARRAQAVKLGCGGQESFIGCSLRCPVFVGAPSLAQTNRSGPNKAGDVEGRRENGPVALKIKEQRALGPFCLACRSCHAGG